MGKELMHTVCAFLFTVTLIFSVMLVFSGTLTVRNKARSAMQGEEYAKAVFLKKDGKITVCVGEKEYVLWDFNS